MNRDNIRRCCLWKNNSDFLKPIIDQPLHFFDTVTLAGPPTFFEYPKIIIVEQPPDYLKFNIKQKNGQKT